MIQQHDSISAILLGIDIKSGTFAPYPEYADLHSLFVDLGRLYTYCVLALYNRAFEDLDPPDISIYRANNPIDAEHRLRLRTVNVATQGRLDLMIPAKLELGPGIGLFVESLFSILPRPVEDTGEDSGEDTKNALDARDPAALMPEAKRCIEAIRSEFGFAADAVRKIPRQYRDHVNVMRGMLIENDFKITQITVAFLRG